MIEELIVVGLDARDRFYDYGPWYEDDPRIRSGGGADIFLIFLIEKVKPQIDLRYRTLPDSLNTGLMGGESDPMCSLE